MRLKNIFIGGLLLVGFQFPLQGCHRDQETQTSHQGKDNIEQLIAAMTTEEKVGMTVGDGKFLPREKPAKIEQGTGVIIANQEADVVIPRLSIRKTVLTDGLPV